jgi:hypothetical protein
MVYAACIERLSKYIYISIGVPVANNRVKLDNGMFFCIRKLAVLQIRPEIISPPQPATLPTSLETLIIQGQKKTIIIRS